MSVIEPEVFSQQTVTDEQRAEMPNPTPEDLKDPLFNAIYERCKAWDVNCPEHYVGYCGFNGSHAKIICDEVRKVLDQQPRTQEEIFEQANVLIDKATTIGVVVKLDMPTAKEVEASGGHKRPIVTVAQNGPNAPQDHPQQVLISPTPKTTGQRYGG